jgi:hypothetical protein
MTPVLLYREPSLDLYTRMLMVWEMFVGAVDGAGRTSSEKSRDGRTFFCLKFWR